jgi:hypothetical protein
MGLDVVDGYYEMGKAALGPAFLAEKAPRLHVIDEDGMRAGEEFGADIVYSNMVCVHVHPDERREYFSNLLRLTHRRGARLVFNAMTSEEPRRFEFDSWSWPMDDYRRALAGLDLVRADLGKLHVQNGVESLPVEFEFVRR